MSTQVSWYQKGKTNLDFTEARDSEWQWHQLGHCKSAPCSRQTTTPALYHSVFYRLDALPAAQPTASKHWRHSTEGIFTVELHITETAVTHWNAGLHILQQQPVPKVETIMDFNKARNDGVWRWQWHLTDDLQTTRISVQTDNHANTIIFTQVGCSFDAQLAMSRH